MSTRTVASADGTRIGIQTTGSGPDIVIVHGSLGDSRDWAAVAELLAADHTVHVLDRRGRGDSGDASEYTMDTEVADIRAALAGLENPVLVGHSYGAICVLEAAVSADLAGVVLYEPPLPVNGPVAGDALAPYAERVASGDLDEALRYGMLNILHVPADAVAFIETTPGWAPMAALTPTWTRELGEIDKATDATRYATISAPVHLILGEATPQHHVDATNVLVDLLPGSAVTVMPGQDHFAHLQSPALVAEAIAAHAKAVQS